MRMKKLLVIAFIATLGFTACSNDEDNDFKDTDLVNINGSINETDPKLKVHKESNGTGYFETGDIWGLYATVGGAYKLSNSEFKVGNTTLYWSTFSETAPVTFSAYYPRAATTISDAEEYLFNAAKAADPDLLVATPVIRTKGEDVNLTFNHVMHQLAIGLSKEVGGGVPGDILDAEISLLNMKSTAKVNLLTGEVNLSGATGTDSYETKLMANIWYVAPQKLTTGTSWIQIKLEGKTYTYKVPADLSELKSGYVTNIQLLLKPSGALLVKMDQSITGWTTQKVIDADIYED